MNGVFRVCCATRPHEPHVNCEAQEALAALTTVEQAMKTPVARYNWNTAKLEWLVPYKVEFSMRPMFFAPPAQQKG